MRLAILSFFFLLPLYICSAQEIKGSKDQNLQTLSIEKIVPLYIGPYILNKCGVGDLLISLRDSLEKEGFTIIDSAKSISFHRSFERELMDINNSKKDETNEQFKERLERTIRTKKILQELTVQNHSCIDTLHNYTITVYLFPKPRAEEKSISFTLPSKSPYRISDVILSLIEREPPKK